MTNTKAMKTANQFYSCKPVTVNHSLSFLACHAWEMELSPAADRSGCNSRLHPTRIIIIIFPFDSIQSLATRIRHRRPHNDDHKLLDGGPLLYLRVARVNERGAHSMCFEITA